MKFVLLTSYEDFEKINIEKHPDRHIAKGTSYLMPEGTAGVEIATTISQLKNTIFELEKLYTNSLRGLNYFKQKAVEKGCRFRS